MWSPESGFDARDLWDRLETGRVPQRSRPNACSCGPPANEYLKLAGYLMAHGCRWES